MKLTVITCRRRLDDKYMVIVADTVGGKNSRQVLSDTPVSAGALVEVRDGKVVQ